VWSQLARTGETGRSGGVYVFMPPRFRNKRVSFYRAALWRRDLARFLLFKQAVKIAPQARRKMARLFNESRKAPFSRRGLDATPRAAR
jgi:hypothetical protein